MHWSWELYGALPLSMRTSPQSIRQAPSPASADDPKTPSERQSELFMYIRQDYNDMQTHTNTQAPASQVRGVCFTESLDVDQSSENHFTSIFFYQDHLRIDRALALLWLGPQKQSIWRFYLFIFLPISVTLGDVSISGSLLSPSSIDVKSLLASVKLNDSTANCTGLCFSPWFTFTLAYLKSPS